MWTERLGLRLAALFRRESAARYLDEEMRFHLEQQIAENQAAGMSADEARAAALRLFGNALTLKESTREAWGWVRLEQLLVAFVSACGCCARIRGLRRRRYLRWRWGSELAPQSSRWWIR